jgi:hypothetical protein
MVGNAVYWMSPRIISDFTVWRLPERCRATRSSIAPIQHPNECGTVQRRTEPGLVCVRETDRTSRAS